MFKDCREEQQRLKQRSLLEAKIEDQYRLAISKNKIRNTDFFNSQEKKEAERFLTQKKIHNYWFFGGNGEDSERHMLLFFPDKFSAQMVEKNLEQIVCGIQIRLPKQVHYEHKIYLSGILKLGVKREKMGDILVRENGADIIVLKEIADFLEQHLQDLTRFQQAECKRISVHEIEPLKKKFEERSIIVSSMRLDNFVAELARTSRTRAVEMLKEQKVFVNEQMETKFSKKIEINDIITIRGKGKFVVQEMEQKTKSEKYVILIKKFIA